MHTKKPWVILGALPLAGCWLFPAPDDAVTEYPADTVDVAWSPIPSPDGRSLAVVLEARAWGSTQTGVLDLGWFEREAAPAVVVAASGSDQGKAVDTLSVGVTSTLLGPTSAWVLQATTTTSWTILAYDTPADIAPDGGLYGLCHGSTAAQGDYDDAGTTYPTDGGAEAYTSPECDGDDLQDYAPQPSFTQVTRIDRTSLHVTGSSRLEPPIATPVLIGDDVLVGLPASGGSDIARDVAIVTYGADENAASVVLYDHPGYGAVTCSGAHGVALAYEPVRAPGSTTVVSATRKGGSWEVHETSLPHVRPGTALACSAEGPRVLVATVDAATGEAHVTLVDVLAGTVVAEGRDLQGPIAITPDGASGIATDATDFTLVRLDASGTTSLETATSLAASPILNGDLALWPFTNGYAVVHLRDGTVESPVAPVTVPSPVAWAEGGAFLVPVLGYDPRNYDPQLTHLYVVTAGHTAELPLGKNVDNPALVPPTGTTFFLETEFRGVSDLDSPDGGSVPAGRPQLLSYDLTALSLSHEAVFPICDAKKVLADAGCSP